MAVRKIPKNHLVVTGSFASSKNVHMDAFESLLEKEYMLLLDFDDQVERFDTQPITIPVPGILKGYTPDVLVYYRPETSTGQRRKPLLTEIKHSDDLRRNAGKYEAKFAAAEKYALDSGWEFRITTETDIRTPKLANIKFLREYRNVAPAEKDIARVLSLMDDAGGRASPDRLIDQLADDIADRLHWIPVIWHTVVTRQVNVDWDRLIDHHAILHLPKGVQ
jgi:hypothetical protein